MKGFFTSTRVQLITIFFFALALQGCTTFNSLPQTVKESSEILGTYSNDEYIDYGGRKQVKLWNLIDRKYEIQEDSLLVKFEMTENKRLKVQLLGHDRVLAEKIIKGQLKGDQCYYKRRFFYIVPILPVLWWFNNEQLRIYSVDSILVFDKAFNYGGVVILWAGGNKGNFNWRYKKVSK